MGRIVAWQPRQVVLTHAILAMARPSESFMLDLIPLHEITSVRAVIDHAADKDEAAESEKAKKKMKKQASLRDIHADKSSPLKAWSEDDSAFLIATSDGERCNMMTRAISMMLAPTPTKAAALLAA